MKNFIDLHLHMDGSLSLNTVKKLMALDNLEDRETDEELLKKLRVSENCRDLNEYLEKFAFPCSLLQTAEAISLAFFELCEELKELGLIYAEIRFAPQLHCSRGLKQAEVVQAAVNGIKKSSFKSNLILCCMRGDNNFEENLETIDAAASFYEKGVCAVDLAGAEALYKTENFEKLFAYAREKNLRFTIHAGEAAGPESVWKAIEYGASRIGHGVRSIEDEKLVEVLAEKNIALEMCPTSNLNTAIFETLSEYPILKLMEKSVKVTVNTDNMTVSNTTLEKEFSSLKSSLNISENQIKEMQLNAAKYSFADNEIKKMLEKEILCYYK